MRRATLILLVVALASAPALEAQHGRVPRRVVVAGLVGLLAGGMATLYAVSFEENFGGCSSVRCVVPVSLAGGLLLGYMIGKELDDLYALRYRAAPPTDLRGRELPLSVSPRDVWYDARTLFVPGEDALELVRADSTLRPLGLRARGLRGIGAVAADSARNTLFVGTPAGLYRFELTGEAPGTLTLADEISALAQLGGSLAVGTGPDLALRRLADSLVPIGETVFESARVVDLIWEREALWVLTEDRLAVFRIGPDGATELGSFAFDALARRLDIAGTRAAVAAGSGGVVLLDVTDHARPRELGRWSDARFAYDVALRGDSVFVAGGPEGLYVLQFREDTLVATGLARNTGFVAALASDADALYLLDRQGSRLRRVPFAPSR